MGKMVGVAEFKAKCLEYLREMERDGQPITLTKRGRVVGVVSPPAPTPASKEDTPKTGFGFLKGSVTWLSDDHVSPADPDWEAGWDAANPPELYR